MKFTTAVLAPLFAAAAANPIVAEDGIKGYGIEEIEWEFPSPQGGVVRVNGTAQQVVAKMGSMFPKHNVFLSEAEVEAKAKAASEFAPTEHGNAIAARTDFHGATYNCNWPKAWDAGIVNGIQYLRSLNGRPTNGPGPGNCGRVSCAYDNAIWWCNDTKQPKTLAGWGSIADGAQFIESHCYTKAKVGGQVFHPTGWNVIVRSSSC